MENQFGPEISEIPPKLKIKFRECSGKWRNWI